MASLPVDQVSAEGNNDDLFIIHTGCVDWHAWRSRWISIISLSKNYRTKSLNILFSDTRRFSTDKHFYNNTFSLNTRVSLLRKESNISFADWWSHFSGKTEMLQEHSLHLLAINSVKFGRLLRQYWSFCLCSSSKRAANIQFSDSWLHATRQPWAKQ